MARARNIKPGFFRNADLVELSYEARLLFIGLWTIADRSGRLEDRPKQIKMELFPADNIDCEVVLGQLESIGMIARYDALGVKCIQVVNFAKHQNPHRDEKASILPTPDGHIAEHEEAPKKHGKNTVQAPCKEDANTMSIGLNPDPLIPDSLNPEEKKRSPRKREAPFPVPDWINREHWDAWHSCGKRKNATNAQKQMAVDKLDSWRQEGIDHNLALENAAIGGWQGLFKPDGNRAGGGGEHKYAAAHKAIFGNFI